MNKNSPIISTAPYSYAFPDDNFPLSVIPQENAMAIEPHIHSFHEFVLVTTGSARHHFGKSVYRLGMGDIFLVPPGMTHGYSDCKNFSYYNFCIDFGKLDLSLFDLSNCNGYQLLFIIMPHCIANGEETHFRVDQEVYDQCCRILEQTLCLIGEKRPGYQAAAVACCLEFFCVICCSDGANVTLGDKTTPHDIWSLAVYLQQNINQNISVDKMCKRVNRSRSTLFREFKKYYNSSPVDFHLQHRLRHAAKLLRHSNFTVENIANQCGFSSGSYFTAMFKKLFGVTPLHFRRQ